MRRFSKFELQNYKTSLHSLYYIDGNRRIVYDGFDFVRLNGNEKKLYSLYVFLLMENRIYCVYDFFSFLDSTEQNQNIYRNVI